MVSFCKDLKSAYLSQYTQLERLVSSLNGDKYIGITNRSFGCGYTRDGKFMLTATGATQYLVYNTTAYSSFALLLTYIDLFDKGFHELFYLDYTNEDENLNAIFKRLLKLDRYNTDDEYMEELLKFCRNGIWFGKPYKNHEYIDEFINDYLLRYDSNKHPSYICEHVHVCYDHFYATKCNFLFKYLMIKNVWSVNDILVTSSMAELNERNYLGYLSFQFNNTNAVYANPKIYEITNGSDRFWIDICDSYTNKQIDLSSNFNVLI